jgi:carboxymethylenebutenolidase
MPENPKFNRRDFVRQGLKGLAGLAGDAGQVDVSPPKTQIMAAMAPVPVGDFEISAYIARPEQPGSYPAVVIIHEVFGLVQQLKDVAVRFAREGYVAIVPDLFSRETQFERLIDRRAMGRIVGQLSDERMIEDLRASLKHLELLTFVDHHRTAAVGFGVGGAYAFRLGTGAASLRAAVDFYGYGVGGRESDRMTASCVDAVSDVSCPILGIFASEDSLVPLDDVTFLKDELLRNKKPFQIKIYPGASHGFFNETDASYRSDMAEDAWKRMHSFLHKYLR